MPYDEDLAVRVRQLLTDADGVTERKMFGGLAFMIDGHMCCGIVENRLMVRVGPDAYRTALQEPSAREMDFTGRPLGGMVYVEPSGIAEQRSLAAWVDRGVDFVRSLPPKSA